MDTIPAKKVLAVIFSLYKKYAIGITTMGDKEIMVSVTATLHRARLHITSTIDNTKPKILAKVA